MISSPIFLPVYIHIPKNAGTYMLSWMQTFNNFYHCENGKFDKQSVAINKQIRKCIVDLKGGGQSTCCVISPNNVHTNSNDFKLEVESNPHVDRISEDVFLTNLKCKNLDLFSITFDPVGNSFLNNFTFADNISKILKKKLCYSIILRDPFERALSLFSYLQSSDSIHEKTHNIYNGLTIETYLRSFAVEDSYVIRSVCGLHDDLLITDNDFNHALNVLKGIKCHILGKNNLHDFIDEIFLTCYGISTNSVPDSYLNLSKNKTTQKIDFKWNKLSQSTQNSFKNYCRYDYKLIKELSK
jgi:hypothetical protein